MLNGFALDVHQKWFSLKLYERWFILITSSFIINHFVDVVFLKVVCQMCFSVGVFAEICQLPIIGDVMKFYLKVMWKMFLAGVYICIFPFKFALDLIKFVFV